MIRRLVRAMSEVPVLFDGLRWILEGGFHGHQSIFSHELSKIGEAILDLGCGTGQWAGRFAEHQYLGIDIVPEYVIAARRKHPGHTFILADGRCLPLDNESIDMILISGVLHHLDDKSVAAVIKECFRVLRPDGRFVVWEDIPTTWRNPVGHFAHRMDNGDFIRTPGGYRSLLSKDFEIASERTFRSGFMDYVVFECHRHSDNNLVPVTSG